MLRISGAILRNAAFRKPLPCPVIRRDVHSAPIPKKATAEKTNKPITPLGWFLFLIPATTLSLGIWQTKRKAWKEQLIRELEEKTKMPAIPLPENLADLKDMEYRMVKVRGRFLHDKELLIGPRSFIRPDGSETAGGLFTQRDGGNGYLVVTPFKLADRDETILVNRGWVSRQRVKPESRADGQLSGDIELVGVVRSEEKRPQFSPENKSHEVFLYRDLTKMSRITGAAPVMIEATYESSVAGGPIGGQTRVTLRNEHLSYMITWYSLTAATAVMWYRQVMRRRPF